MDKYNLEFSFRYELKDNGDTSQNLFVKTYQGSSLISETDLGDIYDIVVNGIENTNLKQALNEIKNYCNFQIKDNETLIERLEGTNSFRIGKAKSMIIEFKNILQIIDKYTKEDDKN